MEDWVSMKHLVFCSGYNVPTLFLNLQKMSLVCRDRALSMTVSKHVTLYGPRPCLQSASQDCPFLIVPSCFLGPLKVLMAQMHRAAQLVPWWRMGAKLSCYNTEGMAVDHRG
jgi:hypothetical protein